MVSQKTTNNSAIFAFFKIGDGLNLILRNRVAFHFNTTAVQSIFRGTEIYIEISRQKYRETPRQRD